MKLQFLLPMCLLGFGSLAASSNNSARNKTTEDTKHSLAAKTQELVYLKKLTVGPFDNFQPDVSRDGRLLIFTQKQNQVPRLFWLEVSEEKSESATPVFSGEIDAVEPALSPKSDFIAYVRLSNNSRGELCISAVHSGKKLAENAPQQCQAESYSRISSPQWLTDSKIAYLSIPSVLGTNHEGSILWLLDLNSGSKQKLLTQDISSFRVSPDGKSIAWTKKGKEGQGKIQIYFLSNQKNLEFNMELPGLSAFPNFAPDGKYLYFTHFLNDTNQDKKIDGDDHGVIFRIPLSTQTGAPVSLVPEPLTSVETSCVFPIPYKDRLAVTCGFDGSLDIYSIPSSGVIPESWNQADLLDAFRVSRHYHERILIMNALRYRYPGMNNIGTLETLLGLHFLSSDTASTLFYVDKLIDAYSRNRKSVNDQKSKVRYEVFRTLLVSDSLYTTNSEIANQPDLQSKLARILEALSTKSLDQFHIPMVDLARAHLQVALGRIHLAKELLPRLLKTSNWHPLESQLLFSLATKLYDLKSKNGLNDYWQVINFLTSKRDLPSENSIYYAFRWLSSLQNSELPLNDRVHVLKLALSQNESIKTLLLGESISLKLLAQKGAPERQKVYSELDSVMSQTHNDYFLSRAIYIRTILNFSEFEAFDFLDYVAGNWLKYTETKEMEFPYAKRQFAEASFSRAYFQVSEKNLLSASGFFYSAVNLTDELEAHAGFVESLLGLGQKQNLQQRYSNLGKRKDITEAQKYVQVLISLISDPISQDSLQDGISKLQKMNRGDFLGFRQLLMGSLHLKLALLDFNNSDLNFDLAHRYFNLALDLGRTNPRLKSTALMNMARLQQHRGYHNLAIPYFDRRLDFPFVDAEERLSFSYSYARSLYFLGNYKKAAQTLEEQKSPIAALPKDRQLPFVERLALYKTLEGDYKSAISQYRILFNGDSSQLGPRLTYGLALFKNSEYSQAEEILRPLTRIPTEDPLAVKRHWMAQGLISQILDARHPKERKPIVAALKMRQESLHKAEGKWNEFQIAKEDWQELSCRTHLQLAFEHFSNQSFSESLQSLESAIQLANAFSKDQKSHLNTLAFEVSLTGLQIILYQKGEGKSDSRFLALKEELKTLSELTLRAFQESEQETSPSDSSSGKTANPRIEKLKTLRAQLF